MKAVTLVLALVLVVAGCSAGTDGVGGQQVPTATPPTPAGAKEVSGLKEQSVDTSCNPTASYQPTGPLPTPATFTGSLAEIYRNGKLRVGVDQNSYKFGFRNAETGELEGFSIDVAKEIATAIFGDPNKIQFTVVTSKQRTPALKNGDVDIVVHTMTANCDRWKDIDFSTVYYDATQQVLVKKDSDYQGLQSLSKQKVCAAEGSTSLARIVNLPGVDPEPVGVQVSGWTDCLVMLQQNQVYAISTDNTILAGLAAQDPSVEVKPQDIASEPYAIGVKQGDRDLVRFVNGVLDRMRGDGTWVRIYNKWMEPLLHQPAAPPPAQYKG